MHGSVKVEYTTQHTRKERGVSELEFLVVGCLIGTLLMLSSLAIYTSSVLLTGYSGAAAASTMASYPRFLLSFHSVSFSLFLPYL